MKNLTEKVLYVWFGFIVFEAPLRYIFFNAGAPFLVYLKDILLIGIFVSFALEATVTARMNKLMLASLTLVLYGVVVGLINGLSPMQTAFGMKIVLTFFVGFMAVYTLGLKKEFFIGLYRLFVPLILFGLLLELLFDLPWIGFEYEAYGVIIPGSISWWTLDLPRLSGFGRVSYETAILLVCLSAMYLAANVYGKSLLAGSWKILDRIFLFLSFIGIILTTAKSSIFAFLILILFYYFLKKATAATSRFNRVAGFVIKVLLVLVLLYGVIPPVLAVTSPKTVTGYLSSDDLIMAAISASYVERMEIMWPDAYKLLSDGYMYFTGRGLGGIGASQKYFEPELYNAADNVYVYLLVDFGIIILLMILGILFFKIISMKINDRKSVFFLTFALIFFSYGATLNVIESPTLMICLGFLLALWDRGDNGDS
ncbi:MAG: hypothetical protein CVT49_06965 [candidate division Zixibacteria bacterium HGW-Zixibacteria-1]|nr:MAG: hypothetical protein CVT49_06965 [candidate division Zixibacteria bacterium HGW-Zixibacteria-1]